LQMGIIRKNGIEEEQSVNSFGNSSSADLSFSSKYRGEWRYCVESSGPKWEKVSPEH